MLDPVIDAGEVLDGWIMLDAAVERMRMTLRVEAAELGIPVIDHIDRKLAA